MNERWTETGSHGSPGAPLGALRFVEDRGRADACGLALDRNEIVLTIGLATAAGDRSSARLGTGDARRLAADLLAFAGAVDGSSGD